MIIDSSVDLPTPEPAKMPMRCPRPHGMRRVERAHAERERFADHAAGQRVRRGVVDADVGHVVQRRAAVDRAAEAVEHAAEQRGTDRHLGRAVGALRPGRRRVRRAARRAACRPVRPVAPPRLRRSRRRPLRVRAPTPRSGVAGRRSRGSVRRRARRGLARSVSRARARVRGAPVTTRPHGRVRSRR